MTNHKRNMTPNPHLQDQIYGIVGEEVARNEIHPGPMARAVAESNGNRDLVQGLYIKFRAEELYRQVQRDLAAEELRRAVEGMCTCPKCGYVGKPMKKARGKWVFLLLATLLLVIPGILYLLAFHGYKGVCRRCGTTLIERLL